MVEAKGSAFILEAEIQGLSACCWPEVGGTGLFVNSFLVKVEGKDYYVGGFSPEFLWLHLPLI